MQFELRSIIAASRQGGIERPTGIDHQQIARFQEIPDFAKVRMCDLIGCDVRNHQAHLVACQTACLWRLPGLKLWRQHEVENKCFVNVLVILPGKNG